MNTRSDLDVAFIVIAFIAILGFGTATCYLSGARRNDYYTHRMQAAYVQDRLEDVTNRTNAPYWTLVKRTSGKNAAYTFAPAKSYHLQERLEISATAVETQIYQFGHLRSGDKIKFRLKHDSGKLIADFLRSKQSIYVPDSEDLLIADLVE